MAGMFHDTPDTLDDESKIAIQARVQRRGGNRRQDKALSCYTAC